MYITFDTEKKAIAAQKKVWINYVRQRHAENNKLVGTGEVEYDSLNELSNEEISSLVIYGIKNGLISKKSGLTTNYLDLNKVINIDKWYCEKPPESLMNDVTNYQEESSDEVFELLNKE